MFRKRKKTVPGFSSWNFFNPESQTFLLIGIANEEWTFFWFENPVSVAGLQQHLIFPTELFFTYLVSFHLFSYSIFKVFSQHVKNLNNCSCLELSWQKSLWSLSSNVWSKFPFCNHLSFGMWESLNNFKRKKNMPWCKHGAFNNGKENRQAWDITLD